MSKPRRKMRPKNAKAECGSKVAYDSMEAADSAARRPYRMLSRIGFMAAYRCRVCKRYHYGHTKGTT